jgi:uncharacterized protein (DUF58 family)
MQQENLLEDQSQFKNFEQFELYTKHAVEGFITGMHKSPFHGFSVEFSEHKIYNPGESTKHIDWKLYGRTDRLYTKRYEEETNLRCYMVLDTSGSMLYPAAQPLSITRPNKLLFSSICALSIMHLLRTQRDAMGLQFFGKSDYHLKAKGGIPHQKIVAHEIWRQLNTTDEAHAYAAEDVLHQMAERIPKRGLICLFSDLFDLQDEEAFERFFKAIQHLRYQKHEVVLFWTLREDEELQFSFEERPYKFVDLETGQQLKLNPSSLQEEYSRALLAFRKKLVEHCAKYRIELVYNKMDLGTDAALNAFLQKRKKMF